jgi:hypothetical protein
MPDDADLKSQFYTAYQTLKDRFPEVIKKSSEDKEASDLAQANIRLAVALAERMDALAKDPNWKGVDEMNDPKSPFNLDNLKKALTNQSREFCYQFDANGQLLSWAKGTKGRVKSYNLPGMLRGGVDVHNHPSDYGDERPFGWTFSDADFLSYNRSGVAVGIVHSREGEYRMDLPPDYAKRSRSDLEAYMSVYTVRFNAIQRAGQAILFDAIKRYPEMNTNNLHESVCKMAGVMMLKLTEDTCNKLGVKFTFKPNPGYEEWQPKKVDLFDTQGQQELFKSLSKPSPDFKIARGRVPHLESFVAPKSAPAETAPKKTRQPRQPKPAEPTPTNNNYFRL